MKKKYCKEGECIIGIIQDGVERFLSNEYGYEEGRYLEKGLDDVNLITENILENNLFLSYNGAFFESEDNFFSFCPKCGKKINTVKLYNKYLERVELFNSLSNEINILKEKKSSLLCNNYEIRKKLNIGVGINIESLEILKNNHDVYKHIDKNNCDIKEINKKIRFLKEEIQSKLCK